MAWAPTNFSPDNHNVDHILGIIGLQNLLNFKLSSGTFCNLNVCTARGQTIAPNGYDRYILGYWSEVFNEQIFLSLYNNNPQAEFIILTDMMFNDLLQLNRCKCVSLYHWKWFLKQNIPDITHTKKYKLSSLSNRVNQYKFFITAKLLEIKHPEVYFTWNATYHKNQCYDYIFQPAGWPIRDQLLAYSEKLKTPINQEIFVNDPEVTLTQSTLHPAYANSLVNLINETKDNCWDSNFGTLPGPYITEKTWKPLILGNALVFVGQFNIKKTLETIGFNFEYPWIDNYSECAGDLERLEKLLLLIDDILNMPSLDIENGIKQSILHNQEIIRSGHCRRWIDSQNTQGLEILEKIL